MIQGSIKIIKAVVKMTRVTAAIVKINLKIEPRDFSDELNVVWKSSSQIQGCHKVWA